VDPDTYDGCAAGITCSPQRRPSVSHLFAVLPGQDSADVANRPRFRTLEIDVDVLRTEWGQADRTLLLGALVFSVLFHVFVGAHKLWLVLRSMGVAISYLDTVRLRLGEGPLRAAVPLKVGDAMTVAWLWRHERMPLGAAAGAIVFDRGLNFVGASFWLLAGLLLMPSLTHDYPMLILGTLLAGYLLFMFCTPLHDCIFEIAARIHVRVRTFAQALLGPWRNFTVGRKTLLLGYGIVFVLRPILVCYLLFSAYGVRPNMAHVLTFTSMAIFAGLVPGPLMGMGPREGVIVEMFSHYVPRGSSITLSVGILLSLFVYVVPFLIGAPWVPWFLEGLLHQKPRKPHERTA